MPARNYGIRSYTFSAIAETVLSQDSFTDTNGVNLTAHTPNVGGNWSVANSSFSIQSNQAVASGGYAIAYVNTGVQNVTINCDITALHANNDYPGLIAYIDNNNYIQFFWQTGGSTGNVVIADVIAGTYTQRAIQASNITNNGTHNLMMVISGSTITGYFDYTQACQYTGETLNCTKHGIFAGRGDEVFDNWRVQTP